MIEPHGEMYSVIRFVHVIDHRLSPINDEGIGGHRYARFGLKFYEFNEVIGSAESLRWKTLRARHWVVTFKDNTLDVLPQNAEVVATEVRGSDSSSVLMALLNTPVAP